MFCIIETGKLVQQRSPSVSMANTIIGALAEGTAQQSFLMTTVTSGCVVVKSPSTASETAISLSRLSEVQTIKTSYPGLLVIASGLSVVAAAAFCSKDGDGAGIPTVILSASFIAGYFASRRAALNFVVDDDSTRTAFGSRREADKLRKAVLVAREHAPDPATTHMAERPDLEMKGSLSGLLELSTEQPG